MGKSLLNIVKIEQEVISAIGNKPLTYEIRKAVKTDSIYVRLKHETFAYTLRISDHHKAPNGFKTMKICKTTRRVKLKRTLRNTVNLVMRIGCQKQIAKLMKANKSNKEQRV